ncbi:MAG: AmmeMemoRadiSam system radical SAM enzyme [Candidatus Buchananbacteria bacterium RBG_13_36_9]|uniref:AmmeMemoRadiSam system radical SAM enzyme n=1 Tax=Candidatus Buchananbacteria bacterium RBG_13_36_9 TaxID=1797530 RepID=A0A1G1XSV4_9BACT|nr:MAG: AmmeMemoRadiSam system radical SAM enzyme [Candidatus Buchananbacteria bacterium RBG_13_36_9]
MKLAQFWVKKTKNNIQCQLCNHYCLISEGKTGICAVRKNIKGKLYSLVYGKVIAANIDPIEKKPLFHFQPGSLSYSIATVGCNFRCVHCQNADISQYAEKKFEADFIPGRETKPEEIIDQAKAAGCQSIAYTYTEPTIYAEFALDCMKLAKKVGLRNIWVSNGYTAKEAWPKILPYLDAINVDLKFFNNKTYLKICGAKLQPVLDNLKLLKKSAKGGTASGGKKVWTEVTTLIIPGLNDSDKELLQIAQFIKKELGAETPWHISRFFPQYKLRDQNPTEEDSIYKAVSIGKEAGLKYVYGGNIVSDSLENTYCPSCNQLVIKRFGYQIERLDNVGRCPKCGYKIVIIN